MPTAVARSTSTLRELYVPQFEQFGFKLIPNGAFYTGNVSNEMAHGSAWALPLSPTCLVLEHFITPHREMKLAEFTPVPYACVTEVNEHTLACMPQVGIEPHVAQPSGYANSCTVCSFLQGSVGCSYSPLKAGHLYHSRSIMFLPDYFFELERSYPHEYQGVFERFGNSWGSDAQVSMMCALHAVSPGETHRAGGALRMHAAVETLAADLAASLAAERAGLAAHGTHESGRLIANCMCLMEHALDAGRQPSVEELAEKLFVSRSKLCAAFKAETGETPAAYMRNLRIERAKELLSSGSLSMQDISERLGYPQQAAFTQAFKQATGLSPTAWRTQHGA